MKGRGYLLKGDQKAARFIRKQFQQIGLQSIGTHYFQPFNLSQNLFPAEPRLMLNGREMKVGSDFIPTPACGSFSGRLRLFQLDSAELDMKLRASNKSTQIEAWVIPSRLKKWAFKLPSFAENRPKLLVWKETKLTHSLSEDAENSAVISILGSKLKAEDSIANIRIVARVDPKIESQNVVGMVKGTLYPDSFLVLCAHYDHLGSLGKKVYFPGASDNASGSAMLLEMASYFSKKPLRYSLLFIAFSGEEAGLLGSQFFVQHPIVPLSNIKFVMNMDLMGFGEKGATVVNATIHPAEFKRLRQINESHHFLTELKSRGKAANSDHYPFSEAGVPAFFIYTMGGPGYYHDVDDKPETVTFSRFTETFRLITTFMEGF